MKNYGMVKEHNPKSKEIYDFISDLDFKNGDFFIFKSGGVGVMTVAMLMSNCLQATKNQKEFNHT